MGESQSKENGSENKKDATDDNDLLPLWIGLGVCGGAIVSIIAAPFVIAGIGFGAGGIVAGSMAASMMSASGPVAAGSLIAILQSIGAAGMGAASMGVAAAAGGVVGGSIATGLATLNESKSDVDESSKLKQNKKIPSDDSTSYKIKVIELKRLFKDVPSDEWLIADYSGALVDDIFVPGRLYLTPNYFCFYSNRNGKEITKVLNLRDIVNVKKESYSSKFLQYKFITYDGVYVFVNLEDREDSYELFTSIWKKSRNSELTSPVELLQTITNIYGMDLGFRDTEEVMAFFVPGIKKN